MRKEKAAARLENCEVNDFKWSDFISVCREFNNQCAYCLKKGRLTRDHIVPLARGGNHTRSNIVPACRSCNSSKGKLGLEEWFGV